MTRSRGGKGFPIVPVVVLLIGAMVIGQVFFPDQMPWKTEATGADTDTTTGGGIQQTFDNSKEK